MIWRYRKISNGHYDSHYFVCEDAGVIQKIIANPGIQYTYSTILEVIADGVRCGCDAKYPIVAEHGFCTFQPLRKDADKVQWADIGRTEDGEIFDVDPEKTYMNGRDFVHPITTDPRILYIHHRASLENIHGQKAINAAFKTIPSREEALQYLREIGGCTEWKPLR